MAGAVRYEIRHVSRYRYAGRVRRCAMLLCLEPRGDEGQRLLRFEIESRPAGGLTREMDCFGNARHVLDVHRAHRVLEIATRSTVDTRPAAALPPRLGAAAWREIRDLEGSFADWDFTHPSPLIRPSPALAAFVERHRIEPGGDPLQSLLHLSETLHRRLHYIPGATSAESPVDHVLRTDRGVCQDYAHAMIAVARSWGDSGALRLRIPARDGTLRRARAGQRHPRLGRMPAAGSRLDRFRPHQPKPGRPGTRSDRGRSRLSRRVSDPGHHSGWRRIPSGGRGAGAGEHRRERRGAENGISRRIGSGGVEAGLHGVIAVEPHVSPRACARCCRISHHDPRRDYTSLVPAHRGGFETDASVKPACRNARHRGRRVRWADFRRADHRQRKLSPAQGRHCPRSPTELFCRGFSHEVPGRTPHHQPGREADGHSD